MHDGAGCGDVLELFTDEARRTVVLAQQEAQELGHPRIGSEHLLLGLIRQPGGAADALAGLGVQVDAARTAVREAAGSPPDPPEDPAITFTRGAKVAMENALRHSRRLKTPGTRIGTEHLLLGAVTDESEAATAVLRSLGVTPEAVRSAVQQRL